MFIFNSKEDGLILERTERQTGLPVPSNNEKVTNKVKVLPFSNIMETEQ